MLNLLIRFRYFILFIIIIITGFFTYKAQYIDVDFSTRSLFMSKDNAINVLQDHRKLFGDDDNTVLIVLKSKKIFTPSFFYMLNHLTREIEKIKIKRIPLKLDKDKVERELVGLDKKIVKKDEEKDIFNIDEDEDESEDEGEEKDETVLSILETPIGKMINPIESVISLTNVKNIYGQKDSDGINSMVIGFFLDKDRLSNFKIDDYIELTDIKKSVMKHHMLKRSLISEDGLTTAIVIKFDDIFILEHERTMILDKIDKIFSNYLKTNAQIIKELDLKYGVVGVPVTQREYSRFIAKDMFFFFGLSSLIMGLVLFFIFKRISGVFLPLGIVSLASIITFGIMEVTNESLNLINNIIPTLILVIGLSDMIHILHRYYVEININKIPKKEAILITFKDLTLACFITSFTTAIGFFSLLSAEIDIIRRLGIYSGIGVLLAFMLIILVIPGLLYILPEPKTNMKEKELLPDSILEKINTFNKTQVIKITLFFLVLISVSIYYAFNMNIDVKMLDEMKPHNIVRVDTKFAEKNLTGVMPIEINIKAKNPKGKYNVLKPEVLEAMDKFKSYLRKNEKSISSIAMISDYIKESYWASNGGDNKFYKIPQNKDGVDAETLILNYFDSLKNSENSEKDVKKLITDDGNTARISLAQDDIGLKAFFKSVERLKVEIDKIFPKTLDVTVTGGNYVAYRAMKHIISDMLTSLAWAFLFIAITMIILLRSVKLGLLSMIPNIIPILFTMGLMGFTGITVRTSTVLIFSIALGIGVDDTIHFLSKYKRVALLNLSNEETIKRTLMTTGKAIIFTSFLIIIGVLVLTFSEFLAIVDYAILTSVTMLAALIANLFILPLLLRAINPLGLKK